MNKYIYVLIIALFGISVLFFLQQGTAQVSTKHYQNGELSFDYPANWQVLKNQNSQIAVFKDPETGDNITISRQVIPTEYTLEESLSQSGYTPNKDYVINPPSGAQNDFKPVLTESGSISGTPFTLNTYNIKINGAPVTQKELWLQKNNALYSVIYKSKKGNSSSIPFFGTSSNSKEFDVIKKSLKVNSTTLTKSNVFASISIPRLGVKWNIRSDSINNYNAVYHYGDSFYPGQDGAIGVIGHHTRYSAPMNHIETLKKGDKIYIDDYLTQKRYVYEVLTTNDIRYDYTTNKIKFPSSSRELILATCWPPGRTAAEIYVHSQLVSVESL